MRAAISAVLLAGAALPAIVLANPADDPAVVGREGQAFGKTLSDTFQFPTEGAGGTLNLGNGESINPNDMAPGGEGLYIQAPNVGGLQGIFDSDESMHDVGRGAQNQLWQDAQAKGNPFDPDPAMRDQPGPSTVSGAVYQIITGVSGARAQVPDLANDPIVNGADAHMLNPDMLESFGDCSIQSEVIETSRPVHVPDIEFCERVMAPAPSNCQIKHEIIVSTVSGGSGETEERALGALHPCLGAQRQGTAPWKNSCAAEKKGLYKEDSQAIKEWAEVSFADYYSEICPDGASSPAPNLVARNIPGGSGSGSHQLTVRPTCSNGLRLRTKTIPTGYWVRTVAYKLEYDATKMVIEEDSWYPQECIDIANSSSG